MQTQKKLEVVEHLAAVSTLSAVSNAAGTSQAAKGDKTKSVAPNKILDFLSTSGKLSVFLLAITPLPTYIGVWGKSKAEQVQRVESISYAYLLLNILCNSVWTSYAFKTQNIDLAIISVFPLVIAIILSTIYLSVKPQSHLIQQFFGTVLIS